MAWTHYSNTQRIGQNKFLVNYAGQADASDLTDYVLFDISAKAPGFTKTQIESLKIRSSGGLVAVLEWDATTDDFITASVGHEQQFPPPFQREDLISGNFIVDPASTGTTGDILLTTIGGALGRGVSIEAIIHTL